MSLPRAASVVLLTLGSAAALSACSKREDASPTCGVTWTADGKRYTATSSTLSVSGNQVTVNAVYASGNDSYSLYLNLPDTVGTHATGNSRVVVQSSYLTKVGGVTSSYQAYTIHGIFGLGTVSTTVTALTAGSITGTFFFTGSTGGTQGSTLAVTNGTFALPR